MSSHGIHFTPPGAFARDVTARVREAFRASGEDRFGDAAVWWRAAGFGALGLGTYCAMLSGYLPPLAFVPAIPLAALGAFMMVVLLGHDATHGALSHRGWVNRWVVFVSYGIVGIDGALWRERHIRLHHQVANLPGTGIDADSVSWLRLAPDKPWQPWHRFQPLYAPLLYALGHSALAWIDDVTALRAEPDRIARLPRFIAGKALHLALFVLLPWMALRADPLWLLAGYLWASACIALAFVVLVVGTHVSDLAAFPPADVLHDWATHQLVTSVDWAPTSRVAAAFSGGANAHVAHHLFPGHSHRHLATFSNIIAQTAAAHGLPHHVTSFAGMVRGHWRHLVALRHPPSPAG